MDFDEVVTKRRSIRKFKEDRVPNQILSKILEAGRWAPSAGNTQPWRFIVITEAEAKEKIASVCTRFSRKAWTKFSPERARYLAARGGSWDKSAMAKIPVLVAVCCTVSEALREELVLASAWCAVENMLLAATAEGVGSCIYTFYDNEEENHLKEALRMPQAYRIAALIQLGYAAAEPPAPARRELKEIVYYEHF